MKKSGKNIEQEMEIGSISFQQIRDLNNALDETPLV